MDLNSFGLAAEQIRSIVNQYGTPLYIYNQTIIKERYLEVDRAIQDLFLPKIHYAVMANDRTPILETLRDLGAAVQVNSPSEFQRAHALFRRPGAISVATTNISDQDFNTYNDGCVYFYLDSLNEIERYGARASKYPEIGVRVRFTWPDLLDNVTNVPTHPRIGIQPADFHRALDLAGRYGLKITGLHGYLASNVSCTEPFLTLVKALMAYATCFPDVGLINLGGGFGIANLPGETDFDFPKFVIIIKRLLEDFRDIHRRSFLLRFEPGRFVVGPAGIFVTRIINKKITDGITYLGVDGSFGSFPRPYMYGAGKAGYHPVWPVEHQSKKCSYSHVCGCSTLQNDFLAIGQQLPALQMDDLLAFGNAGAYCATLASGFPGQKLAREVFVTEHSNVISIDS